MNDINEERAKIYRQKDKILRNFDRCLKERSLENMSHLAYLHYTMNCGFLHLLDAKRFTQAFNGQKFINFLDRFLYPELSHDFSRGWSCGIPVDCEVTRIITERIRAEYDNIVRILDNEQRNQELQVLQILADKLGYSLVPRNAEASVVVIPESEQVRFL